MLIDAHVHIFPKVDGYGPKGHTHGAGYGRIDAGDGIAQDVLPAINEKTSHTLQMLPAGTIRSSLLPPLFLTLGVPRRASIMPKSWKDRFGKTLKLSFLRRAACTVSIPAYSWTHQS